MQATAKQQPTVDDDAVKSLIAYARRRKLASDSILDRLSGYFAGVRHTRVGGAAVLMGYLRPRDIVKVLATQANSDLRFGEIAVQASLLSRAQLNDVLALQRDPRLVVLALLSADRRLTREEVAKALRDCPLPGGSAGGNSEPLSASAASAPVSGAHAVKGDGERVRATLRQINSIAALPQVVQRALTLLEDASVNLDAVGTALQTDTAIVARVLRLANTAFFGARRKVTDIRSAMVTLGTANVRQVLLMATVMDRFMASSREVRRFWDRAVLIAQWAATLARARPAQNVPADLAFTGGILLDLGKLVVRQHFPAAAVEIARHAPDSMLSTLDALAVEQQVLGLTHADIGAYLCDLWGFPPALTEAVLCHHQPIAALRAQRPGPLTLVVHAACAIGALPASANSTASIRAMGSDWLDYHQLDPQDVLKWTASVVEETRQMQSLLG